MVPERYTRIRFKRGGGHVHCRVFSGPDKDHCGKNGDLCFEEGEWELFRSALTYGSWDIATRQPFVRYTIDFVDEGDDL